MRLVIIGAGFAGMYAALSAARLRDIQGALPEDMEIALELERIALSDEYFISRKLYPNVDFYTGLIYRAMHFPTDYFTVLFAIARTAGWMSQWEELLLDKEQKIARPRQIYTGPATRDYPKKGIDLGHKVKK